MVSGDPSADAVGLRISAVRAGQRGGGGWDDDDAWGAAAPVRRDSNGSDGGTRRGARGTRRRLRQARPAAQPATVRPPGRPAAGPSASNRLKVQRQRRRRRRTLVACTFLTTVCTFVTGVGYVYLHDRLGQIKRLDLAGLAEDSPGGVMNVLLVGSDSLAGVEGAGSGSGDQAGGRRSDTMMILHVDQRGQKAAIVAVPQDLFLTIGDGNAADRVSAAFSLGGPELLIATLQEALGVPINHYMEVELTGFRDIVDAVGGVTLNVPYPARDSVSGLALDRGGCVELDGDQALSWVRSRQLEFLVNGSWQPDARGELGRIERQQDLVHRVMGEALSTGAADPIRLNRLIGAGVRNATLDSALSTEDISGLGRRFRPLGPDVVALSILPTSPLTVEGRSVLALQVARAQPLLDMLNGRAPVVSTSSTAPAPATPSTTAAVGPGATTGAPAGGVPKASEVKVRVLNGVGTPGAAAKVAAGLTSLGFTVSDKGDASSISPKTTITYASGQLAKAQLLAASLVAPAILREDATLRAVDVNLVLGGDFTGVKAGISSGTSAVSTTVVSPFATVTSPTSSSPPASVARTPPC